MVPLVMFNPAKYFFLAGNTSIELLLKEFMICIFINIVIFERGLYIEFKSKVKTFLEVVLKGLHKTFWGTTKKFENKNLT